MGFFCIIEDKDMRISIERKGGLIPELEDSAVGTLSIANDDSSCLKYQARVLRLN